jgi:hypothetical protein
VTNAQSTQDAVEAYQDARDAVSTDTRAHLLALADHLATQAAGLITTCQQLAARLEDAEASAYDRAAELDLGPAIRTDHDRFHTEPWSVCSHGQCRQARDGGQR